MVKFEVNGKLGNGVITLPTNLKELVDYDYLYNLSSHIDVADDYSLIALCHKEKLSQFVIAGRGNKKEMTTSVVPLFIKSGKSTNIFINAINRGAKIIISGSALSLGHHVNVANNHLNMSKFAAAIDGDKDAMRNALAVNTDVYFVEFKLIPNNEIVGVYNPIDDKFINPFCITLSAVAEA